MGRHCSCISAWLDGRTSGLENCCQPLQGANGRSICRAGNRTNKHFIEEKGTEFRHHVRSTSLGRQEEGVGFLQCFDRSEEHTSELQSRGHLVCRLLLEKKKQYHNEDYKRTLASDSSIYLLS